MGGKENEIIGNSSRSPTRSDVEAEVKSILASELGSKLGSENSSKNNSPRTSIPRFSSMGDLTTALNAVQTPPTISTPKKRGSLENNGAKISNSTSGSFSSVGESNWRSTPRKDTAPQREVGMASHRRGRSDSMSSTVTTVLDVDQVWDGTLELDPDWGKEFADRTADAWLDDLENEIIPVDENFIQTLGGSKGPVDPNLLLFPDGADVKSNNNNNNNNNNNKNNGTSSTTAPSITPNLSGFHEPLPSDRASIAPASKNTLSAASLMVSAILDELNAPENLSPLIPTGSSSKGTPSRVGTNSGAQNSSGVSTPRGSGRMPPKKGFGLNTNLIVRIGNRIGRGTVLEGGSLLHSAAVGGCVEFMSNLLWGVWGGAEAWKEEINGRGESPFLFRSVCLDFFRIYFHSFFSFFKIVMVARPWPTR